jgi:hypothetical protein
MRKKRRKKLSRMGGKRERRRRRKRKVMMMSRHSIHDSERSLFWLADSAMLSWWRVDGLI